MQESEGESRWGRKGEWELRRGSVEAKHAGAGQTGRSCGKRGTSQEEQLGTPRRYWVNSWEVKIRQDTEATHRATTGSHLSEIIERGWLFCRHLFPFQSYCGCVRHLTWWGTIVVTEKTTETKLNSGKKLNVVWTKGVLTVLEKSEQSGKHAGNKMHVLSTGSRKRPFRILSL